MFDDLEDEEDVDVVADDDVEDELALGLEEFELAFLFLGGFLEKLTAATSSGELLSSLTAATVGLDTAAGSGAWLDDHTWSAFAKMSLYVSLPNVISEM